MKKNNKGVSLVELIISMSILSIVIIPITMMMIQAARYNGEARQRQKMTLITESVMEGFKAYSIEELETMFGDTDTFAGISMDASGVTTVTNDPATGAYTFELTEIQGEGERYDAVITVTPYALASGVTQSMAELDDVNPYTDAVMRMLPVYDTSARLMAESQLATSIAADIADELNDGLDQIKDNYDMTDINAAWIDYEKRETLIHLVRDAADGKTKAICSMTYYYQVDVPYHSDASDASVISTATFPAELDPADITDPSLVDNAATPQYYVVKVIVNVPLNHERYTFYTNNTADVTLKRVYVYFFPAYGMSDIITFKTEGFSGDEIECHLLKQLPQGLDTPTGPSTTEIQGKESSYSPSVARVGSDAKLKLYHNLNVNIAGGASVGGYSISTDFDDWENHMTISRMNVPQPLIYSVSVNIYDAGDDARTKVLASLNGTLNK